MLQGRIQGSTSYANDEVVFPSYEMLNRLKNVSEVSLYNQAIYAYFPVGFDAQSSPWFPPWTSYIEACRLRVIAEVLKFPAWIPYFEASNFRTFAEVYLENVSLSKFLITIVCRSLTLILSNISDKDTATYFAAW